MVQWGALVLWAYSHVKVCLRCQGSRDQIPLLPVLFSDGSASQLEIDGSTSDRKKRRKRKQLKSDGSVRQLRRKRFAQRNSIQEWLRERTNGFASKAIKWSTPVVD